MNTDEALRIAERWGGPRPVELVKFGAWADKVTQEAKASTQKQRDKWPWFREWAESWSKTRDLYDRLVQADPLLLYVPANRMAREFHDSHAWVRMLCSGNRCSKTWSMYAEVGGEGTGRAWGGRIHLPPPCDVFLVGVDFQKYATSVFEAKMIDGEPGVPFSPMFPEGGKWFRKYDERKKRLELCCPNCAERGRAGQCTHRGSTFSLFSDNENAKVLQGAAARVLLLDEEIDKSFWLEGQQRLATVPGNYALIGFTPLLGPDRWQHTDVAARALGPKDKNHVTEDIMSPQFASYHTIDQFEAGIVPHDVIKRSMLTMDDAEIEARVYGRPVPIVERPVFPRQIVSDMLKVSCPSVLRGELCPPAEIVDQTTGNVDYTKLTPEHKDAFTFKDNPDACLRVWQPPMAGCFYIAAVDCAIGLASGDPACCSIIRVTPGLKGTRLHLVAQYHGWINSFDYAAEVIKLAVWYNGALVAIENTGGYGEAVTLKLREYGYWNFYVDESDRTKTDPTQESRIGVSTNSTSKPFMVAAAQRFVLDRTIDIPCADTLREMMSFEQARTANGTVTRYRGAQGTHDDRVMSIIIGCAVAVSYPLYKWEILRDLAKDLQYDTAKLDPRWREILAERTQEIDDKWEEG